RPKASTSSARSWWRGTRASSRDSSSSSSRRARTSPREVLQPQRLWNQHASQRSRTQNITGAESGFGARGWFCLQLVLRTSLSLLLVLSLIVVVALAVIVAGIGRGWTKSNDATQDRCRRAADKRGQQHEK